MTEEDLRFKALYDSWDGTDKDKEKYDKIFIMLHNASWGAFKLVIQKKGIYRNDAEELCLNAVVRILPRLSLWRQNDIKLNIGIISLMCQEIKYQLFNKKIQHIDKEYSLEEYLENKKY